jgi:hypothetical protein
LSHEALEALRERAVRQVKVVIVLMRLHFEKKTQNLAASWRKCTKRWADMSLA